jgi:serpin B
MKKMMLLPMTLMLGIVFAGSGCAAEHPQKSDFTFDLYRTVAKEKPDGNVTVSPYCAELLLDFVRAGAAGKTKAEIDKVISRTGLKWIESAADSPLTTAAALWTQKDYSILPAFLKTAEEEFGASVEQADFANNAADAVRQINAWCSEKTNGKIDSLFDNLDATTRCVLAGAIHFAADWKVPFLKELTMDADFALLDGQIVKTKMMSRNDTMNYGETDETLVVELPYNNEGYAMVLLLPQDAAQFSDWESKLTAETLKTLREGMKPVQVDLKMPQFTVESELVLNETLKQLGIQAAFRQDADFSKISGKNDLYLNEVRQKTFIKVDETGTEAAAVTGAVMAVKMAMVTKPFYANRPFLYLIVKDNEILFFGRFAKPEAEKKPFVDPGLDGEGGAFS